MDQTHSSRTITSKLLFGVLLALTTLSIAATYYKMIVLRDFIIIDDLDMIEESDQ